MAVTQNGKPAIFFEGVSDPNYNDNASSYLVNQTFPTTLLRVREVWDYLTGGAFSIVVAHPPGYNAGDSNNSVGNVNYVNPSLFGGVYGPRDGGAGSYSPQLIATTGGFSLAYTTNNAADYYQGTRPPTATAHNVLTLLQGKILVPGQVIALRKGMSAYTVHTLTGNTQPIIPLNTLFHIAGFMYPLNYGEPAKPKISELITMGKINDSWLDTLAARAATEWGITL